VLFSDLRGFTSFSQSQPARQVIDVVNHYLNEMTEAILDAGGTIIAYMGDGIMAVFGAPLEQEDNADRAVAAAREMVGPRLDRFNDWLESQGFDRRFEMGLGLHSGPVMAGNVGSEQRMEYTAIGDTTNTASRLEGMTKDSDAMVFISTATRERMHGPRDGLEYRGEKAIRGREEKLGVWTFVATPGEEPRGDGGAPATGTTEEPSGHGAAPATGTTEGLGGDGAAPATGTTEGLGGDGAAPATGAAQDPSGDGAASATGATEEPGTEMQTA
jgi:adenylate cyclase